MNDDDDYNECGSGEDIVALVFPLFTTQVVFVRCYFFYYFLLELHIHSVSVRRTFTTLNFESYWSLCLIETTTLLNRLEYTTTHTIRMCLLLLVLRIVHAYNHHQRLG